jgi:hypothetical protein
LPQVLASVVAAVGAFIKGGGLKRLLEAVLPIARTVTIHPHRGATLRFPPLRLRVCGAPQCAAAATRWRNVQLTLLRGKSGPSYLEIGKDFES